MRIRWFVSADRTISRARHGAVVQCSVSQNKSLFIFGIGYTGQGLAKYTQQQGW
jgi:hypothetical protein